MHVISKVHYDLWTYIDISAAAQLNTFAILRATMEYLSFCVVVLLHSCFKYEFTSPIQRYSLDLRLIRLNYVISPLTLIRIVALCDLAMHSCPKTIAVHLLQYTLIKLMPVYSLSIFNWFCSFRHSFTLVLFNEIPRHDNLHEFCR